MFIACILCVTVSLCTKDEHKNKITNKIRCWVDNVSTEGIARLWVLHNTNIALFRIVFFSPGHFTCGWTGLTLSTQLSNWQVEEQVRMYYGSGTVDRNTSGQPVDATASARCLAKWVMAAILYAWRHIKTQPPSVDACLFVEQSRRVLA